MTAEKLKENAVEVNLTEEEVKDFDSILENCKLIGAGII